jgi:hemolysin III
MVHSSIMRNEEYWRQSIAWYPDGCFGPYRSEALGYTRRELAADGAVHAVGFLLALGGVAALLLGVATESTLPAPVSCSICVYGASLLAMITCSATFNGLAWSKNIWALQLADHAGILLLIAGTYTPVMVFAGCPRVLGFVWALALLSFGAKASRSRLDVVGLHVPCFLLMGWAAVSVWGEVTSAFSPWAKHTCLLGGAIYTAGLVPWAANRLEGHNALWHACVLAASACFFAVVRHEVAQPAG